MNKLNIKPNGFPFSAKKLLTSLAISVSLLTLSANAANKEASYDGLAKQLTIMNNIFKSSLQAQENKKLKSAKVDSLYLAGQGVVFTVSTSNSFLFNHHDLNFVFSDMAAPVPPLPPVGSDVELEFFTDDGEIIVDMESMHEAHEQEREHYRDLHEQQRDLARELRDLARESKDLAFQRRNISKEEQKDIKAEQEALEQQKSALEKTQLELDKKLKQMKVVQQKQLVKRQKQRSEHNAQLTSSLIETLCLYGNSLKALPKSEHVSLIIKSAGEKAGRSGYKDRIYVFAKKDILACTSDKITSVKLATVATSYQF
ncbi:MAG: hypothetical protein OQK09_13140 [Colwellia sp.]|nr:hypothetical protein [Colwellia sp.]MCW8866712.1 hypothetical protein [Colwellia sp.]MCW9082452.1 hypothetical protein [Colwellia sp.]